MKWTVQSAKNTKPKPKKKIYIVKHETTFQKKKKRLRNYVHKIRAAAGKQRIKTKQNKTEHCVKIFISVNTIRFIKIQT
jgi:hypothetical protein